jgi:hypothetical protein
MKSTYWWNNDFETLMTNMRKWLGEHPNIELVNVDWKYAQPTGKNQGSWYMVLFYKGE